ncbi:unnamed protein product [Haemonchus placei]|uniref:MgtE domain-containing protein n=1 Tax=Haemonchus placei TaxID=6290 RepID=A0A0N4W268_HAEPC|nr:unnamed protein product [Haemonchus placei]
MTMYPEPTQKSSFVAVIMEKESTSDIFWQKFLVTKFLQTLIPFMVGGLGSVACGLIVNRAQKTDLVCEVPHLIAICVPLQGMKGNLDMTFTSRLGTMVRLKYKIYFLVDTAMVVLVVYSYRKAINPDNIGTPIAASCGDLLTIMAMLLERHQSSLNASGNSSLLKRTNFCSKFHLHIIAKCQTYHESRAAFLILMTSVPYQLAFVLLSHAVAYVALTPLRLNILFLLGYLITVFIQSFILLYLAEVVVYSLFHFGIDPDLHAIPLLTSIGDLLGTALLCVLFLSTSISPE